MATVSVHTNATQHHINAVAAAAAKDHQCRKYALFLHSISPIWFLLGPMVLIGASTALTIWIRKFTPGVCDEKSTPSAATSSESTSIPAAVDPSEATDSGDSHDQDVSTATEEMDEPPPYQPPAPVTEENTTSTPTASPATKYSSAERFVIGTCLLVCNITCLVLLALTTQSIIFCQDWSPLRYWARAFWWTLFLIPTIFATFGLSCWAMLFRDLWGPGMKKKYPMSEHAIAFGLLCVAISPFVFLWFIFGVGSVKAIEACQRTCCAGALEDDEDEDVEMGDVGLRDGEEEEDDGSGELREGDRVPLMTGSSK